LFSDHPEDTPETSGERFLEGFPRAGSMLSGTCYQQQPSAPLTSVKGSSPLLPTPTVQDGSNVEGESQTRRNSPPLNALVRLLPTPTANDDNKSPEAHLAMKRRMSETDGSDRTQITSLQVLAKAGFQQPMPLLPTLTSASYKQGGTAAEQTEIKRILGVLPSGESTDSPSSDGSESTGLRLAPSFVEWMMGLPQGWSDPDCLLSATEFSLIWESQRGATSSTSTEK
jgi:hypothetical protein